VSYQPLRVALVFSINQPTKTGFPRPSPVVLVDGRDLFGIIEDGGGIFRLGNTFHKLPPRPIIRDALITLAIEEMARSMTSASETSAVAIRRTASQQLAQMAKRELEQLW
jgi:hypothetical protein